MEDSSQNHAQEINPDTHWTGGWLCPTFGLGILEKRETCCPLLEFELCIVQPAALSIYWLHCSGWTDFFGELLALFVCCGLNMAVVQKFLYSSRKFSALHESVLV